MHKKMIPDMNWCTQKKSSLKEYFAVFEDKEGFLAGRKKRREKQQQAFKEICSEPVKTPNQQHNPRSMLSSHFSVKSDVDIDRSLVKIRKSSQASPQIFAPRNDNKKQLKIEDFEEEQPKPTTIFCCKKCHCQVFSNLDIYIHDGVQTQKPKVNRLMLSKLQTPQRKLDREALDTLCKEEDAITVGSMATTFGDFKSFRSVKGQKEEGCKKMGEKKYDYKCQNIFTDRPEWMDLDKDDYLHNNFGLLTCPNQTCKITLGTYSMKGTRCQTCANVVLPSYQFFKSKLSKVRLREDQVTCETMSQVSAVKLQKKLDYHYKTMRSSVS